MSISFRMFRRAAVSAVVLAAVVWGIDATRFQEKTYDGLPFVERQLQQGLDFLDVPQNIPFDGESARLHFEQAAQSPDATQAQRAAASFLSGWSYWTEPVPRFDEARKSFKACLVIDPHSPFALSSLFLLSLIDSTDPLHPDYAQAVEWSKQVVEAGPGTALASFATVGLAGLYREHFNDKANAALWYGRAADVAKETHILDERLGFRYLQGKFLQELGRRDEAIAVYKQILAEGENESGTWPDRVLDRLDELGVSVEKDYFPGIDLTPIPMAEYRYTPEKPVEIAVSFWILEKPGMRRAIEEIIRRYEERTPKVRVRLVDLPFSGYHDWLQSQILGREIPDIVQIDNTSAIRYGAYQSKLVETTPYLDKINPYTGIRWSSMYYPQFIMAARDPVFRRNWVISWASENTAYFYNKDVFRKAGIVQRDAAGNEVLGPDGKPLVAEPQTWDELIAAFKKLQDIGVYGEVCNFFPDPAPIIWQLPFYRKQLYNNLISKYDCIVPDDYPDPFEEAMCFLNGSLDLRDPEVAEPWKLLYEKCEYWAPGSTSMDIQQAFELFARGKAATIYWVSTDMPTFEKMCDFELGVFPFPLLAQSPGYDGVYSEEFTLSAFEFAVPKVTQERGTTDAVMDFLMFYTSPEAQELLSREAVCLAPIRGIKPPDKLEPFLRHMNRRGTFQVFFDPYTIAITKEPYWVDARDKLWNEQNRLMGSVPNYEYFQRQFGGSRETYQEWRTKQFDDFSKNLQDYFVFAYSRVVEDYPEDCKREVGRLQHRWLAAFRERYFPISNEKAQDAATLEIRMSDFWRGIVDNTGVVTRCESMIAPEMRAARYTELPLSFRAKKEIQRTIITAFLLLLGGVALFLLWSGVFARIICDFRYLRVLAPTLLLLGVFAYTPAASAIYHSFYRWNGSDISEFIGLDNFQALLTDGVLHHAIMVVLVFLVVNIIKFIPTVIVSVLLFHLANQRMQYIFRVIFVLPMAIPGIVGLLIWKYLYRMDGGLLNWLFVHAGLINAPVNWLGAENTVVPALLFIGFPWVSTIGVLILLAGLQSISTSVFEAAQMDGCGVARRLFAIELPLIMGQIKLNAVLVTIGTLQDFWLPLVLTRGGPNNASMLPGLWMYQNAFSYGKMGYAAALGVAMFIIILLLTYINMKLISTPQQEA